MMLGGVPISVTSPPRIDPNATGISSRDGGSPFIRATCMATGIISASAPTLFMNMESSAASPTTAPCWA